jgi:hypothetical protein
MINKQKLSSFVKKYKYYYIVFLIAFKWRFLNQRPQEAEIKIAKLKHDKNKIRVISQIAHIQNSINVRYVRRQRK